MTIRYKMRGVNNLSKFVVIFFIFLSTVLISNLQANSFSINEIEVSEDFNLNFNKKKVFDKAFESAFFQLISTIILSKDIIKIKKTSLSKIKSLVDSFTVSDEKRFYHCFSSGEHGNVFDFVMKTQSIKFGEAVRQLALQAGMQPYKFSKFDAEKEKRYETYKNILKDFAEYHHKIIFSEDTSALNYLEKRGIGKTTILEF